MQVLPRFSQIARGMWVFLLVAACTFPLSPPVSGPPTPTTQPTPPPTRVPPAYWPTQGWRTSPPEQQGMDSGKLVEMLAEIQKQDYPIHGVVIVRNGYLVLEAYIHPFQDGDLHPLYSATKSVTSALIGNAILQGYLASLDQKMLDFFQNRSFANLDAQKKAITLEHLLTMSSGLDWPTHGLGEDLFNQWYQSQDRIQFLLDRPMAHAPGTNFTYNSAGSYLLSAILWMTTGSQAQYFAQKNLFTPMGITDFAWSADQAGVNFGGSGLELTLRDLAKFGYLYLQDGVWDGKPLLPAGWVADSTHGHIATAYHDALYGYHWWVNPTGGYQARGYGGQRLFVFPEEELVVVFVGGFNDGNEMENVPTRLLESYILPAIQTTDSLPENPKQAALLAERLRTAADPEPRPVPPLPALAHAISGKMYTLQSNPMGINAFILNFSQDQASIKVYSVGETQDYAIGLDGVSRFTQGVAQPGYPPPSPIALKGSWVGEDTFELALYQTGDLTDVTFVFKDKDVTATIQNAMGAVPVSGTSRAAPTPQPAGGAVRPGQHPYSMVVQVETSDHQTQTVQVNFLLYLPESYGQDPLQKWPLILFLHGRGERGNDLNLIKKHPLPKTLESQADFPFIVISPQLSLESITWATMVEPLNALLDQIQKLYAVDPKRIYLTGLSMGGYGAWEFAARYPERFAAVAPIAGGYDGPGGVPENICELKQVPFWVFHGASDTIVPPSEAEVVVEALQACGGNVRNTLFPGADHESSFYQAYADPELYHWLAMQSLK